MKKNPPLRLIDITGRKYNMLTVIKRVKNKTKNSRWLCRCDCGNLVEVDASHLKNNGIKSCGCLKKKAIWTVSHGLSKTRIYEIWHGIKNRCYCKKNINYKNYGERGIKVCKNWKNDFKSFYIWAINNGYKDTLSIDRIDVNKNYEPNNCRWVSTKEQANNKRNNRFIEYKGITHTISEWSEILNIKRNTLDKRINKMSIEEAFNKPIEKNKSHPKLY